MVLSDPRVEEVVVVGLPHEKWTEAISAFIVKSKGAELTEADIVDLCKTELSDFEIPKKIVFVDELPKTSTGKMQKNIVRKQYQDIYK